MKIEQLYSLFTNSTGICTDTRKLKEGNLFIALKGGNFNGNKFALQAIENGASSAIVDEVEFANESQNIFLVENGLKALQKLATYHRNQLNIPFIGLTGSNGKTTTKELIAACLSPKYNVAYTYGNLNNHIGVPLTLLSIKREHTIAVIEMGANHLEEIEALSNIAQPDFGYITNFGKAHLEGFGGVEGVIKGKSELYDFLRQNNRKVFVNADDAIQVEKSENLEAISFSFENKRDYNFQRASNNGLAAITFKNTIIQSHLSGSYNEVNLAAAVTIGLYFGVDILDIKQAVDDYIPNLNRSQEIEKSNYKILMDAYNANPTSMDAALNNFIKLNGTKTVILGDMFELGETSQEEHSAIVRLAIQLGFESVVLIGEAFNNVEISAKNVSQYETRENFAEFLKQNPIKTNRVLIKGSRGMALEKLLEVI